MTHTTSTEREGFPTHQRHSKGTLSELFMGIWGLYQKGPARPTVYSIALFGRDTSTRSQFPTDFNSCLALNCSVHIWSHVCSNPRGRCFGKGNLEDNYQRNVLYLGMCQNLIPHLRPKGCSKWPPLENSACSLAATDIVGHKNGGCASREFPMFLFVLVVSDMSSSQKKGTPPRKKKTKKTKNK